MSETTPRPAEPRPAEPRPAEPRPATTTDLTSGIAPFLGLGFGSGLSPWAPGTVGTVIALPIYFFAVQAGDAILWAVTALAILIGPWICEQSARQLKSHDHPAIVWDEIAGLLLTLAPFYFSIINMVLGFFLFRLFDILKPWPIGWVDRQVDGGLGIMLDDLIAAVFAILVLWGINYVIGVS